MAALPWAFFDQVSKASCSRSPRYWMAKSTMVVVPPNAAAMVPDSKSSADVVPPKGMSRCVWTSMPPGSTYFPVPSITRSACIAIDEDIARVDIGRGHHGAVLDQDAHVASVFGLWSLVSG